MKLYTATGYIGIKFNDSDPYMFYIFLGELKSILPDGHSFFINYKKYPRAEFMVEIPYDSLSDFNDTGNVPDYATVLAALVAVAVAQEDVQGGTDTPSSASYSADYTIPAGAKSVIVVTGATYAGNILGVAGVASTTYSWTASPGNTLAAIPITRTGGTFTVSKVV